MSMFFNKIIRAIQLDPQLYLEVSQDKKALKASLTLALLSNISAGIGASAGYPEKIPMNMITAFLGWLIWCVLVYGVGAKFFPEKGIKTSFWSVVCFAGFANIPRLFRIFAYFPAISAIVLFGTAIWTFAGMAVATEKVFQKPLLNAVGINLMGWLIYEWLLF